MPDLNDLLSGEVCPACPACPPWPGWQVTLELPADALPFDLHEFVVRPGIINAPEGGRCTHVDAWTIRGEGWSEVTSLSSSEDCVLVPEPSFALQLLLGWFVLSCVVSPLIGRRLRKVGESYPSVPRSDANRSSAESPRTNPTSE